MHPERLWAKSWDSRNLTKAPRSAYFAEHLKDVLASADRVLTATAADQLSALGLPVEMYSDRFRRIVRLAAAIHDLGKANDHFQTMVRGKRDPQVNPQGLRHEWGTILIVQHLRGWLIPTVGGQLLDLQIAEWAIAGHHPAPDHHSPPRTCPPGAGTDITLLVHHPDFRSGLEWLRSALGVDLGPPPVFEADKAFPLTGNENAYQSLAKWEREANRAWDALERSPVRRLVPAVKNCLIAADIAGSALPRQPQGTTPLWDWIDQSFDSRPKPGNLDLIAKQRLGKDKPRNFQTAVAESPHSVTFVKGGCGSGKTLAAYLWAAKNFPEKRLYFCYPTTGTATEGFRDYLFPESENSDGSVLAKQVRELGAELFHSRRDIDLEIILAGRDTRQAELDAAIRIEALDAWSTPIVACTCDMVLGIVQNNKRGLLSWPALAQSAFVFDEIHAFDDRLFGALLRFLRDLPGLPVLLMTASLPKAREEALRKVLEKLRSEGFRQPFIPIPGPTDLEELARYYRATVEGNDPLALVAETIRDGGKVLWVCNTVKRVMEAAAGAEKLGLHPLIYHSRYRYEDRVERHKVVIGAFQGTSPALAICSQVAEMSLDLSADLLVSDLATVPAMIQRLGRLNRRAEKDWPTKPFVVIEPDGHLPYSPADLQSAREWLDRLPTTDISQKHLSDLWEQTGDRPPDLIESAWLDGGPITAVSELRESSPGITVLMESDRSKVREKPRDMGRYSIPMPPPPRGLDWKTWDRERGMPIAPDGEINYCKLRGAEWRRK